MEALANVPDGEEPRRGQCRSWNGHEEMTEAGPDDGGQPSHLQVLHTQRMTDGRRGRGRVTQCEGKGQHRRLVEGSVISPLSESLGSFGMAWVVSLEEVCVRSRSQHLHIAISKDHQNRTRSQGGSFDVLRNSLGGADFSMTAGWLDHAVLMEMRGYVKR